MFRPSSSIIRIHKPQAALALVASLLILATGHGAVWAQSTPQNESSDAVASRSKVPLAGHCPDTFAPPVANLALSAYLEKLADLAEACDARSDYFAHRGSLLLIAGRLTEAATNLEKALLLAPELPGAQLDFAQALALLGQKDAALQLVEQVGGRKDIDPGLRQWLSGFQPQAKADAWTWNTWVQSSIGHETNLNSTTHTDTLTLFLSNGPVTVNLSEAERPRAGMALKNWVAWQAYRPLGSGEMRVSASGQARNTFGSTSANSHQIDGSLTYAHPLGPGVASFKLGELSYLKENIYAYDETAATFKYEPAWRLQHCPWGLSLGWADQRHQTTPIMSGTYQWARLEGQCKNKSGGITAAHLSAGADRGQDATRPGGDKIRREYGIRHDQPMTFMDKPGQASLWLKQQNSKDTDILSLLLGPKVIYQKRLDMGMGYWWRWTRQWSAGVDFEYTRQNSNNELSQLKNSALYTGLRWTTE